MELQFCDVLLFEHGAELKYNKKKKERKKKLFYSDAQ